MVPRAAPRSSTAIAAQENVRVVILAQISVTVTNLNPGVHAIHVHEAGKCDAPDFNTAGTHFNAANKKHGMQNPEGHHAGDLPNLTVGPNGKGAFRRTIQDVTLAGDGATFLFHSGGTSVVIREIRRATLAPASPAV